MTTTNVPRLKERYNKEIVPSLKKTLGVDNDFEVPKLVKIVLNIGVSEARENIKVLDIAKDELTMIAGQQPKVTRSKKAISNFKLRQGMPIGLTVTLRSKKMYEFLDRLINISIPRQRDFRGLSPSGFDGKGNYNLGLREQYIFPEVDLDKSDKARGMNITVVTTAASDDSARELLRSFGMPFKKKI